MEKKAFVAHLRKGRGDETYWMTASTPALDRDGERILPEAFTASIPRYMKNPVILWGHDYSKLPIGKALDVKVNPGKSLTMKIQFAGTPLGQEVRQLFDEKVLNSFSVGFIPKKSKAADDGTNVYTECELLEVSAVTIPSNPEALMFDGRNYSEEVRKGLGITTPKKTWDPSNSGLDLSSPECLAWLDSQYVPLAEERELDFSDEELTEWDEEKTVKTEINTKLDAIKALHRQDPAKYEDALVEAIRDDEETKSAARQSGKAREAERMAKAMKCDASEPKGKNMSIEVGAGEYKGVSVRKTMDLMLENAKQRGADDYLKARPEAAEAVATFWIDKTMGALRTKANELITTTDTLGGYLTPTEQESAIASYVRHTSIALQDAKVIPMHSDTMSIPVAGTAPAITIEANELTISQATPTFDQVQLVAKRHSGRIPVSWEMQADEGASLVAYLANAFYEDLGKTIDSAVFFGPGTLVDGSGVFNNYDSSAVLASAAFSSVVASDIYSAVGKLTPERRAGAGWYFRYDNFWDHIADLTNDSTKLYEPSQNTMLGHKVRELWTGPDTGTGAVLGIFGNLKGFIVGSRLMNTQLMKVENENGYTNFVFFTRLAYANPLPGSYVGLVAA